MARPANPKRKAEVRAAYLKGEGSLRELAKRFGFDPATVLRWAAADDWVEARERVAFKAQSKADEKLAESMGDMMARHKRWARAGGNIAGRILEAAERGEQEITAGGLETLTGVIARVIPLERLSAAIEPNRPVKPIDPGPGAEVIFEIDGPKEGPDDDELAPEKDPAKS